MCNVRYEYTTNNNSLIETAFEHIWMDNVGYCYKCKLCDAIFKSTLDAWLHIKEYHGIKTLNDYKAHEELKKTMNETTEQQEQQKQNQNDKIIKKVVKPRPKTILDFILHQR